MKIGRVDYFFCGTQNILVQIIKNIRLFIFLFKVKNKENRTKKKKNIWFKRERCSTE